jgi:signal peptidase
MVRGVSMLPTYKTGDLIITRKASSYRKGDIVAYHVPKGQFGAGIVVIHRIIGGTAAKGFVIQGDNNPFRDDWTPTPKDIVGKAWVRLPRAGVVLLFLHSPLTLASLGAGIVIVFVLFPEDEKKKKAKKLDRLPVAPSESDVRPGVVPDQIASPAASSVDRRLTFTRPSVMAVLPCVVHARTNGKAPIPELEPRSVGAGPDRSRFDVAA